MNLHRHPDDRRFDKLLFLLSRELESDPLDLDDYDSDIEYDCSFDYDTLDLKKTKINHYNKIKNK